MYGFGAGHRARSCDSLHVSGKAAHISASCHLLPSSTRRAVSEATYRRVLDYWGVVGIVELTALVGYYTMVAMTLNAHEFPLPEGVEPPFEPAAV